MADNDVVRFDGGRVDLVRLPEPEMVAPGKQAKLMFGEYAGPRTQLTGPMPLVLAEEIMAGLRIIGGE